MRRGFLSNQSAIEDLRFLQTPPAVLSHPSEGNQIPHPKSWVFALASLQKHEADHGSQVGHWENDGKGEHLRVQLHQNGVALRPQASLGPCQSEMRNLRAQQLPTLEVQSISVVTFRETDWVVSRYVQCWSRIHQLLQYMGRIWLYTVYGYHWCHFFVTKLGESASIYNWQS